MTVTNRLDWPGFVEQMRRLHNAQGWNIDSPVSKVRMAEYWDRLRFYCTTAELTVGVTWCLDEIKEFPSIAEIKQAVRDRRSVTRPNPVPAGPPGQGGRVLGSHELFGQTWRRIRDESRAEQAAADGDAKEPEGHHA
jgi:hypothetical protein